MKLKPICDCDNDKVITGQFDGEMIWRQKTSDELRRDEYIQYVVRPQKDKSEDEKWEIYQANAD